MDEVDGMSAGDRGGVGALNALIKKSKVRFCLMTLYLIDMRKRTDPYHLYSKRP